MHRAERIALKKRGFRIMRKHYGLLMILAMIAIILGSEFSGGALFLHLTDSNLPLSKTAIEEHVGEVATSEDDWLLGSEHSYILKDPGIDVFRDIISGNVVDGVKLSEELQEKYANSGGGVLGHTEGVIASLVGTVTSGHLYIKVLQAIFTITDSPRASLIIFVILSVLVYSSFFAFIREPYTIMIRRMYLEARTYDKVPFYHVFHLKHSRRWIRASMGVIYADFLYALWFFTIAGAFIKRYSYYMVPYILAENPDIRPREAIALSRRMMDGHKMECFKLEMTFIGWLIVGFLTGGFLNAFFYAPYKLSVMSEYYVEVRAKAIEKGIQGAELLDDDYLVGHADPELLEHTYRDVEGEKAALDQYKTGLTGVKKFFAENMAIWTGTMPAKEEYQIIENRKFRLSDDLDAMNGLAYPDRLNPRLKEAPLIKRIHVDFLRCYTAWNLLLMFFMFAFIGWIWEVILFIIQTGELVNRGSLYGPWIPIYGAGGTMILVILCKLRTRPLIEFISIAVLSGIVEYTTSYLMELSTGMRWWDYSGYFLNIDGRVCAEGLFAFAALGSLVVYFLAPLIDTMLMRVNNGVIRVIVLCLSAGFIADVVYAHFHPHTGKGVTDMGMLLDKTVGLGGDSNSLIGGDPDGLISAETKDLHNMHNSV